MEKICLNLIVEVYNQEKEIETFSKNLVYFFKKLIQEDLILENSQILFLDNASKDNSWYEISKENVRYPNFIKGLKLATSAKSKAINSYFNKKENLTIKINLKFSENEILNIIQTNKQGFFDLSKKKNFLKEFFLINKFLIKEEI